MPHNCFRTRVILPVFVQTRSDYSAEMRVLADMFDFTQLIPSASVPSSAVKVAGALH